jgi:hypothetical protein
MSRDRASFKQRDVAAVLRATKQVGLPLRRIEIRGDPAAVVLIPGEPETTTPAPEEADEEAEILRYQQEARDAKI